MRLLLHSRPISWAVTIQGPTAVLLQCILINQFQQNQLREGAIRQRWPVGGGRTAPGARGRDVLLHKILPRWRTPPDRISCHGRRPAANFSARSLRCCARRTPPPRYPTRHAAADRTISGGAPPCPSATRDIASERSSNLANLSNLLRKLYSFDDIGSPPSTYDQDRRIETTRYNYASPHRASGTPYGC